MIAERFRRALVVGGLLLATALAPAAASLGPAAALTAAAAEAGTPDPVPAEEVRRAVDEVLSRRAYRTDEPGWLARWAERARRWLAELFVVFLRSTSRAAVGWTVLVVATAVATIVAWRLVRGTRWEASRSPVAVDHEQRTATDWEARSRAAERRGDLREAVRTAYRAVLAGYDEMGLVREVEGRTVGEYRRAVAAADPGRRESFDRASDVVEAVLYADRPASTADLATVRRAGGAVGGARRSAAEVRA